MDVGRSGFLIFLSGRKKKKRDEPVKLPSVKFSMPDVRHEMWKCNRCGSPVFDGELELHSSFHSVQDRLLEKLMMTMESFEELRIAMKSFEGVSSSGDSPTDSGPLS